MKSFLTFRLVSVCTLAFFLPVLYSIEIFGHNRSIPFFVSCIILVFGVILLYFEWANLKQKFANPIFCLLALPIFCSIVLHGDIFSETHHIFFFNLITAFFIYLFIQESWQVSLVMVTFLVGLLLTIIYGIALGDYTFSYKHNRITVSDKNPNDLAVETLFGLNFLLYLLIRSNRKLIVFCISLLIILCIYLIVATGTRFSIYSALIIFVMLLGSSLFLKDKDQKLKVTLTSTIFLLITILIMFSHDGFLLRLFDFEVPALKTVFIKDANGSDVEVIIMEQDDSNLNLGGRFGAWQYCFKIFQLNPLIGIGDTNFKGLIYENGLDSPHNFIIYSAVIGGAISAFFAIILLIRLTLIGIKMYFWRNKPQVAILLFSLCVTSLMMNIFYLKIFWLAVAISAIIIDKDDINYQVRKKQN